MASFANPSGLTRLELEELTGLSRTVVAGVVTALLARGELTETRQPSVPGTRGRPPSRYQRTALLPPVLLIQMLKDGSTLVSSVRGDGTRSRPCDGAPWSASWREWSAAVADAARRLRDRSEPPPRLAVLSAPFPVAEGRGAPRMYTAPSQIPKLSGKLMLPRSPWLSDDPRPALGSLLECPALMVNDANLAALGEARFGAGRGRRAVVHVCVAKGIGAGFVFNGRLFTGAHGFSGELAHVQVTPDGPPCKCGNHGCLITEKRRAPGHRAELGSLVGRALAPLVTMLDPDCVVVDARLGEDAGVFITRVTEELARRCPPELAGSLVVVAGELWDAEPYGALAAADAYAAALISESAWPASLLHAGSA